jgi:uncharacterized protein
MTNRVQSIDFLRGVALLGLPTLNIVVFSMPIGAYLNPYANGDSGLINDLIFSFFNLFADQKFMGIFSALFGVSVMLLADKNKIAGKHAGRIHYSRTFWLIAFGFLHGWFLWEGDVLLVYGIIALVLYPVKRLNTALLVCVTVILLSVSAYMTHYDDISADNYGIDMRAQLAELYSPSDEQKQQREAMMLGSHTDTVSEFRAQFTEPTAEAHEEEPRALTRLGISGMTKIWGMMCLGMLLFKLGIVQGNRTPKFYQYVGITSAAIGITITAMGLIWNYTHQWNIDAYFRFGMTFKELGSTFMTVGYICLLLWVYQRGSIQRLANWISRVGQMALTNYLTQSLLCALIFYGYGFGLYGSLSRIELLPIIVGIAVFQVGLSVLWLRFYKQGPIEWIWRTLTYMKWQAIHRSKN